MKNLNDIQVHDGHRYTQEFKDLILELKNSGMTWKELTHYLNSSKLRNIRGDMFKEHNLIQLGRSQAKAGAVSLPSSQRSKGFTITIYLDKLEETFSKLRRMRDLKAEMLSIRGEL